jgi:fructosamine-3-kinase
MLRVTHPLLRPAIVAQVERAASEHLGRRWVSRGFSDRNERASHPCGILHGQPFSVFAKLSFDPGGREQFAAELAGLGLLRGLAGVATPTPIAAGIADVAGSADVGAGVLFMSEALLERSGAARSPNDYRSIGRALAAVHRIHDKLFGLAQFDGFFGSLPQDNHPVPSNRWADFYAERRVLPSLRLAVDSGHLAPELAAGSERILRRLPALCGPEPLPSLLHGDAQQNNFVCTPHGAVLVDPAPFFGHPELDLALLDIFEPLPGVVLDAYHDVTPIDSGFAGRRELWRIFSYLAVIAVDGGGALGRKFGLRLADALARYG